MPQPRRRRRAYKMTTGAVAAALALHRWIDFWGGPEEGRRAWEALAPSWRSNLGTRPAPFWAYTEGVPDHLRESLDPPDERWRIAVTPEEPEGYAAARERWEAQRRQRLGWLVTDGQDHLRAGELEYIREKLRD